MDQEPYSIFARFYDDLMKVVDYGSWVKYILELLEFYRFKPQTIVDLACGTGNASYLLARLGYHVIGIDKSAEMLAVAQKKNKPANGQVEFYQYDMRSFQLNKRVDLIICLYDSINYLLTEKDLFKTFCRVKEALKPEGFFIFDFNTCYRIRQIPEKTHLYEGKGYSCFWQDKVDYKRCIWQVDLDFFLQEGGEVYRRYHEKHRERGYMLKEITDILEGAKLEILDCFNAYTFEKPDGRTPRVYVICRRPK